MSYVHPVDAIREFQTTFGENIPSSPVLPSNSTEEGKALRDLRIKLLREEFEEYLEGEENDDLVEIADAIADIVYIAFGTGNAYGLPMKEIFDEVQKSNMSKLGEDGKPIYREDGKIMKGPNYFKPDIAAIVAKYQNK